MQTISFDFEAIGTHWRIDIPSDVPSYARSSLLDEIMSVIEEFDVTYSRFRKDSLITKMSQTKGTYLLPENATPMVLLYEELYKLTKGLFTPLIGQVLVDAGYDATYSLQPTKMTSPASWEDVISFSESSLTLRRPALLDFGAGGKGYLIYLVSAVIKKHAIHNFCVEAGGDIYYLHDNNEKLPVGLENPDDSSQIIGIATIHNQSICASAGNRRRWGDFHHIIDPFTLTSPKKIKATWVVAATALLADALSTCLFFTPAKKLLHQHNFSYAIVREDNTLDMSKNFPANMFVTKEKS